VNCSSPDRCTLWKIYTGAPKVGDSDSTFVTIALIGSILRAEREEQQHERTPVDAIDAMLRDPHNVRQQLISEIRDSDDASAARADALLARTREGGEHT
jgi:hypothetical protein